jgi:hypothetical protein
MILKLSGKTRGPAAKFFSFKSGIYFFKPLAGLIIAAALCASFIATGSAAADSNRFLLNITQIKIDEFPHIYIKLYFRNRDNISENGLSASNFILSENRVPQGVNLTRTAKTISLALIIDSSLIGAGRSDLARKSLTRAASYLDSLDKMAVFTFCPDICSLDFTGDKKLFNGGAFDRAIDYTRTADELILFAAEKLSQQLGNKHIIYITADPFFINEAVLENINLISEEHRPAVNFLKLNAGGESADGSFFGSAATRVASSTGGVFREAAYNEVDAGIDAIMSVIKSNYKLDYISTQPYSNGRKRALNLGVNFMDSYTSADAEYTVNFNLPELDFGLGDNPVFYQEIDPESLSKAVELGLSLSANVKFAGNKALTKESTAVIGFGAFRVNGKPDELNHCVIRLDNLFNMSAARYKFSGMLGPDYLLNPARYIDNKEKIEVNYKEKKFFASAPKNAVIKKAGIYWTPIFRDGKYDQWVRVFMSFTPDKLVFDGTLRYAIYLGGYCADGRERDMLFDGVQLQYGLVPTVFTEYKTIHLGPQDINKPMIQPLNPRIEYQMK